MNPPSSSETPSETEIQSEDWRIRMRSMPLPGYLTHEELDRRDAPDYDEDATCLKADPSRVALLRRSKRLEDNNPMQFVFYPPNFGEEPPKKVRKPRKDPMIIPDFTNRLRELELQRERAPPLPQFSPGEIEEMRRDLTTCPKSRIRSKQEECPPPGYISVTPVPAIPTYVPGSVPAPLLTKVNESTLTAIGWKVRRGDDGRLRACPPDSP